MLSRRWEGTLSALQPLLPGPVASPCAPRGPSSPTLPSTTVLQTRWGRGPRSLPSAQAEPDEMSTGGQSRALSPCRAFPTSVCGCGGVSPNARLQPGRAPCRRQNPQPSGRAPVQPECAPASPLCSVAAMLPARSLGPNPPPQLPGQPGARGVCHLPHAASYGPPGPLPRATQLCSRGKAPRALGADSCPLLPPGPSHVTSGLAHGSRGASGHHLG